MVTHASIALIPANCTSCMLCIRACPVWCMDLDAHLAVEESGGRRRSSLVLDRFAIDYRTCMMCGLCVDVCPFEALEWADELPPPVFAWERPAATEDANITSGRDGTVGT
jgi:NADH-quinone oxidoreductase subunit I